MKLISLNINIDTFYHLAIPFLKQENPDVICLQEFLEEDLEKFKKDFGMEAIFMPQTYIYHPSQGGYQNRRYGLCILSKHKIINSGFTYYIGSKEHVDLPFEKYFKKEEYYSDGSFKSDRSILCTDINFNNKIYRIITTHFTITKNGLSSEDQLKDLESLFKVLKPMGEFVLCGDMNAPRGRETFTRLAEKYKDNIPLQYKVSLDPNLHRVKNLPYMVDGLFTTPKYQVTGVKLIDSVSDHMAIVAEISQN